MPVARIAIEGGWFNALATADSPTTAAELATMTGAEELLIGKYSVTHTCLISVLILMVLVVRLMRVLTAAGIVDEKGPQTYGATAVTRALTIPKIYHGLIHL